jgi:ferritin-like protein
MFPDMSSDTYHEPLELLSEDTKNTHRAIVSLMEELEAIDWYQQRAEACSDPELAAVLTHNKNEEVEHAMMTLEWLRRKQPVFADNIDTYINSTGPILEVEEQSTGGGNGEGGSPAKGKGEGGESKSKGKAGSKKSYNNSESLGIGSLKGHK